MSGTVQQFEGGSSAVRSVLSRPVNQRGYIGVIAKVVESIPARLFLSSWHSNARLIRLPKAR
jgi:hypothetical protein